MFDSWTGKLLDFDQRIGPELIRPIYYLGLIIIAGIVLGAMLMSLSTLFSSFFGSLGRLIGAPFIGLFAVLIWRLICEWAFLHFTEWSDTLEMDEPYDVDGVVIDPDDDAAPSDSDSQDQAPAS